MKEKIKLKDLSITLKLAAFGAIYWAIWIIVTTASRLWRLIFN